MRNRLLAACLALMLAPASRADAQDVASGQEPADAAADVASARKAAEVTAILDAHLASSASPRDQLLRREMLQLRGSASGVASASPPPPSLKELAARAPADRLVQWAWASASASDSACPQPVSCPGREAAMTRLEPENALAWLPTLNRAWEAEDEAGVDTALAHMAAASRYEDLFIDWSAAWAEVQDRYPDYVAARTSAWSKDGTNYPADIASTIAGVAMGAASAVSSIGALSNACDRGKHPEARESRFQHCAAIGRLMQGKGSSAMSRMVGFALIKCSVGPSTQDLAEHRAFRWAWTQADLPGMEKHPEQMRAYFDDLFKSRDEMTAMQRRMARLGRPARAPADWKAPGEED